MGSHGRRKRLHVIKPVRKVTEPNFLRKLGEIMEPWNNNHEQKKSTTARGNMRLSYAQNERQIKDECAQEEKAMNKALKTTLCAATISGAFLVGNLHGEQAVLQNQIITDEAHTEGFYTSEYNGQTEKYWYENPTLGDLHADFEESVSVYKNGRLAYEGNIENVMSSCGNMHVVSYTEDSVFLR